MRSPAEGSPATAARLLLAVTRDRQTSDQALARIASTPRIRDTFYGTLRHLFALRRSVDSALRNPLASKHEDVYCLMLVGAYQLAFTRVPDHAAINETVAGCRAIRKPWARGLVNAVLRQIQRRGLPIECSDAHEHPPWMTERVRRDFPDQADAIFSANMSRAPMCVRVNGSLVANDVYKRQLDDSGIPHTDGFQPEFVILATPMPAAQLPGFAEGLASVQDAGAGFVADILTPEPRSRVLDACAAPGGKLFHLTERFPDAVFVAVDASATRLEQMEAEAARLRHKVYAVHGDATELSWWDGQPFDRILLDTPCSGSGTLRRHPDIRLLREASDLEGYARLQRRLLTNLWQTLRPGGNLLYCTCSLFAEENDQVIAAFLNAADDATTSPLSLASGVPRAHGWQLLPTESRTDGFYYALLSKQT
ncbi:MAG: 16S rRNA (cytosine(967)-C(5))-methyltransferase RsmB [Pseudomonadales bacterium]|nr:16S rRNA (cytosine(967)-C(5))-methyltransferase RsmB [Pseudomonadales bacterium]NIX08693.1 16S rRNA (cytosine(967)-C(5))-methyltransferase RsmB [Pseudomonadales bacterium]